MAGWPFAFSVPRRIPRRPVRPDCPSLLEGSDGAGFVVVDVEDGVELGELQQIVNLLGQLQQLQRAPWFLAVV